MAGLWAILRGLGRDVWREQQKLGSIAANNFFLTCIYFLTSSGVFIQALIGLLLLFPLSADPLRKAPPERLALWPLTRGQFWLLRLASIALSPASWLIVLLAVWPATRILALQLLAAVLILHTVSVFALHEVDRHPALHLSRFVPAIPGRLGGLVRKNLREMCSVLDTYLAAVVALCGVGYRFFAPAVEKEALLALALLVVLAISTYGQRLFALDHSSQFTRYRLMPLRGWQILFAKDAAFLLVAFVLTLMLSPLPAMAAALVVLAVGHHASILNASPQHRWTFTGGTVLPHGLMQVMLGTSAGVAADRAHPGYFVLALAGWAVSLWYYGRKLES